MSDFFVTCMLSHPILPNFAATSDTSLFFLRQLIFSTNASYQIACRTPYHASYMNSEKTIIQATTSGSDYTYVVCDLDVTDAESGRQLAFIEQRFETIDPNDESGERHFNSLKDAKNFVQSNFAVGAEYFSFRQLNEPDNLLYILADKLTYFMA